MTDILRFKYVREDLRELFIEKRLPVHVEVTLRATASALFSYILALASLPKIIPESQKYTIGMVGPMLGLMFPSLMFSILAISLQTPFVVLVALAFATLLLVCATSSLRLYVAMFGLLAWITASTRFDKRTGAMTSVFIMNMALNTQGFAFSANEQGTSFVKSLWTETGVENPSAVMTNSLVGFMWITVAVIVGRIIPPFHTMRASIYKGLLPGTLNNMADLLQLKKEIFYGRSNHSPRDDEVVDDSHFVQGSVGDTGGSAEQEEPKDSKATPNDEDIRPKQNAIGNEDEHPSSHTPSLQEQHEALISKLVHSMALFAGGDAAPLTVFEPRLFRFGPPECSWMVLKNLMVVIERVALSTLTLSDYWMKDEASVVDPEMVIARHDHASVALRQNAKALMALTPVDYTGEEECAKDEEAPPQGVSMPIFFARLKDALDAATGDWARVMGPTDQSKPWFDKDARAAIKLNTVPLIGAAGYGFFKGVVDSFVHFFHPKYWKQVFIPPRLYLEKSVWCLKFGIGFSCLVVMYIYWPKYRALEVPSKDSGATAHFAGWVLIAYAMATTQTSEGSVKKGILRLVGTASGGFSGWLAITACGADNVVGLIVWLTCFAAIGAYVGLPRGIAARMGSHPDYGYGPAVFVMTQGLVAVDVHVGAGGKNDITANRIIGNCVGILMAMVLSLFPPNIYGGNPKYARAILEAEKQAAIFYMQLLLDFCEQRENDNSLSVEGICEDINKHMAESDTKQQLEEANDFYKDASQLHNLPVLKADPKLGKILESLKVIGSAISTSLSFATFVLQLEGEDEKYSKLFLADKGSQAFLQDLLLTLKHDERNEKLSSNSFKHLGVPHGEALSPSLGSKVFLLILRQAVRRFALLEAEMENVKWGIF